MKNILLLLAFALLAGCCSCKVDEKKEQPENKDSAELTDFKTRAPIVIYKTKKDYGNLVPVGLSRDKSMIISYPHPNDIYYNDTLAYPIRLESGYLLDNLGIGINVAYLKITLEEYSKLEEPMLLKDMYEMIIDKDPLTEYYKCVKPAGLNNNPDSINNLILNNKLNDCECLKGKE